MKKIQLFSLCLFFAGVLSAATNTGILKVTLHVNMLTGFCNLGHDSTGVYYHSGAGYTSSTAAWESIVGNWGKNDGIGTMQKQDSTTYFICFNVKDYYTHAKPDSLHGGEGLGPMPANATAYNIGCVFREAGPCPLNGQGKPVCIEGKDESCKDIFITNLILDHQIADTIQVTNQIGDPFDAVYAEYVTGCATTGVHDISNELIKDIHAYPNPFSHTLNIEFNMVEDVTKVTAQIYDVMGRMVADLSPAVSNGYNHFIYNGTDINDHDLSSGLYVLKVSNGSQVLTKTLFKQ